MGHSKLLLVAAMVACIVLPGCHPRQVTTVPAGVDCFNTPKGDSSARLSGSPLPAGFFGADSEPFGGRICFQGNPDNPLDTCVKRTDELKFNETGEASTSIELADLDLVSCEPIVVRIGDRETTWDVRATVSKVKPSSGRMRVTRKDERGGTFEAEIGVLSRMTFTPRDAGLEVRVFDAGEMQMAPEQLKTSAPVPWQSSTTLKLRYDERRGYRADSGFVPGVAIVGGVDTSVGFEHRGERWGHRTFLLLLEAPGGGL